MIRRNRRPAVTIPQLARILNRVNRVNLDTVYRWVEKGLLPLAISTRGKRIINRDIALNLFRDWKHTCRYTIAAKLLGAPEGSIRYFVRKKILISIKFLNSERIAISSINSAKNLIGKDIVNPDKIGFARYSREKIRELSSRGVQSPNRKKMSSEYYRELGCKGGKASVKSGKGHRWTREEAIKFGEEYRFIQKKVSDAR